MFLDIFLVIYLSIIVFFIIQLLNYRKKKSREYKWDERWKAITMKASVIVMCYFKLLGVLIMIGFCFIVFFDIQYELSLADFFRIGTYILFFEYPVEYFALRYYDKVL